MLKKLALILSWFTFTPIVIIFSLILLGHVTSSSSPQIALPSLAELPPNNHLQGQVLGVTVKDLRPLYVENFLKNTPLMPYSHYIVETSDKYNVDYRLIPAIAMKESGGGRTARLESHNAWGFENGRTNFGSWEEAIETVAKTLKERYIAKGLVTPEQIMPIYAPPQVHTGGKWARDINYFFSKMESL